MTDTARGADTIFALSSGALPAAVAIVRISGLSAGQVLQRLAGSVPPPRVAKVRALRDDEGALLDRALVLWLPGPATATGENLAELHLHGGRAVVAAVLSTLATISGCRPAAAGEFTRRAFLNGRIDLVEAEGLADLLVAETEMARQQALRMAEGGLSGAIEAFRVRLLGLAARSEAVLQFGDDEADVGPDPTLRADLERVRDELRTILLLPPAERLRDGLRVVVGGPPNSGKSSLINKITGRPAAIESPHAGTTRDLIEVPVVLEGLPFILIDSAGLRTVDEPVERIGVELAQKAIADADLLLWLGEPNASPRQDAIRIHARADLPVRSVVTDGADFAVSAKTGQGLDRLKAAILDRARNLAPAPDALVTNYRQRSLVASCIDLLERATTAPLPELVCEDLRLALNSLDQIVGRSDVEDMLDSLFGRFCVGK